VVTTVKQGVGLTGRNTTGSPRIFSILWFR